MSWSESTQKNIVWSDSSQKKKLVGASKFSFSSSDSNLERLDLENLSFQDEEREMNGLCFVRRQHILEVKMSKVMAASCSII